MLVGLVPQVQAIGMAVEVVKEGVQVGVADVMLLQDQDQVEEQADQQDPLVRHRELGYGLEQDREDQEYEDLPHQSLPRLLLQEVLGLRRLDLQEVLGLLLRSQYPQDLDCPPDSQSRPDQSRTKVRKGIQKFPHYLLTCLKQQRCKIHYQSQLGLPLGQLRRNLL